MREKLKQTRLKMEERVRSLTCDIAADKMTPLYLAAPDGDLQRSYYLRLIAKKMEEFGLQYEVTSVGALSNIPPSSDWPIPFVADTDETEIPRGFIFSYGFFNVDQGHDMSCCAEAIYRAVQMKFDTPSCGSGKHAVVVGRGPAVQGLFKELLDMNFTVTVCHSHTEYLPGHTVGANLIVLATPRTNEPPEQSGAEMVIDMNGLAPHMQVEVEDYLTGRDIGPLTILQTIIRYCLYLRCRRGECDA